MMIWNDPIVEETRKYRDEYAASFNYDLKAIFLDLKNKEKRHISRVVSFDTKNVKRLNSNIAMSNTER